VNMLAGLVEHYSVEDKCLPWAGFEVRHMDEPGGAGSQKAVKPLDAHLVEDSDTEEHYKLLEDELLLLVGMWLDLPAEHCPLEDLPEQSHTMSKILLRPATESHTENRTFWTSETSLNFQEKTT
jgi:hypothetical protein